MPTLFEIYGYRIFFWSNEKDEPVHVHVCKGDPSENAAKIWLPPDSNPVLAKNDGRIPKRDLRRIMRMLSSNRDAIIARWYDYFRRG